MQHIIGLITGLLLWTHSAQAQLAVPQNKYNLANKADPAELISGVVAEVLTFVAVLAMLMIMTSGIMYMTSAGDSSRVDTAKRWLVWGIIGLIITLLAYVTVNAIAGTLGAG